MNEDKQMEIQVKCFNRCGGRVLRVFNVGAEPDGNYGFRRKQLGVRR